jgi:hypothetical protein
MRRLLVVVSTLAVLGVGFFVPAYARPASGPADALTAGTATIVVGNNPTSGVPNWTTTLSGQFAAGGRTYSGTASGATDEFPVFGPVVPWDAPMSFAGTSGTGAIAATCTGGFVTAAGLPPPADGQTPAGVLQEHCGVSIDGAPTVPLSLVFVLAPTTDPKTYSGVYAGLPDAAGLQGLPVSFGTANAATTGHFTSGISFSFTGQLAFGGQLFHGTASGGAGEPGIGTVMTVPTFVLAGTSATGTVSASCSGVFVGIDPIAEFVGGGFSPALGAGLSVLACNGSANGGPAASAILVSAYGVTGDDFAGGFHVYYGGIFVGT